MKCETCNNPKATFYDDVYPDGKWEFDEEVTNCFENMLERSIPQYSVMRESCAKLVYDIIGDKKQFNILDMGCSDGLNIKCMLKLFKTRGHFLGIDVSKPMLDKAIDTFSIVNKINGNQIDIEYCDLRTDFPNIVFDAILSVLTIQFTPIEYRQNIIQSVYNHLEDNGCFIFVEKVLGNTASLNKLFVDNYYNLKRDNDYTDEQIERKRLSLEGVLVPVTNDWNIDLLRQAGFKQIDVFWRWMNFVGYIAIK